jgi:hypothetical protein
VPTQVILAHRYSFYSATNGTPTAVDLVGSANGTLNGDAVISGGQLLLDGNGYVGLPPGIITNDLQVTVEAWGDFPASQGTWANLWDFGLQNSVGQDSYSMCLVMQAGNGQLQAAISDYDNDNVNRENCYAPTTGIAGATNAYIAAVFNPPAGYSAIYVNGVLAGRLTITSAITPGIQDVNNWIGKDNWGDPQVVANLNEFRIWNGALDDLKVAASYQSGYASLPRPTLTAALSSGNIVISWPVSGTAGFSLYSSRTLGPNAVWTLVNTTNTVVGQNYQISVPTSGGATEFYRLKK